MIGNRKGGCARPVMAVVDPGYDSIMRSISVPFVLSPPSGARVQTRLRPSQHDAAVLGMVGEYLGRLANSDLARRCAVGPGTDGRTDRKRALTAPSSSRWAGAITRTSGDQWERAHANLLDVRVGLRCAVTRLRARLAVPVGQARGRGRSRVRGYQSQAERFEKQRRLQHLRSRLGEVEGRLAAGRVSVCRGGRRLARLRQAVAGAGDGGSGKDGRTSQVTHAQWRERWEAERLFLTADGEADKAWGNETIRVHPDEQWLELRLPSPLAHLSNTPGRAATYRLSCPVVFTHRRAEWAAQAASGAVRYDLSFDPARGRWYAAASWRLPARQVPSPEELRQHRTVAVDLNAGHLDAWVLDPSGNPVGEPHTIALDLDGLPASSRDGRLREAVAATIRLARAGCRRSIMVEDLNFGDARHSGRETLGRGRRGKAFRRTVAGMPTRAFRDLLVGMAANAGLWVVAVDPGWTSKWGERYWQAPLTESTKTSVTVSRHHAAAVVIGRRGLGLGARRRPGVTRPHRRMGKGELPARLGGRAVGCEGPGPPGGQRAAARPRKTHPAERPGPGDQVVQDRSGPPGQDHSCSLKRNGRAEPLLQVRHEVVGSYLGCSLGRRACS